MVPEYIMFYTVWMNVPDGLLVRDYLNEISDDWMSYNVFFNTLFFGDKSLGHQPAQTGCVYPMIVVSILLHVEFEHNDNREDAPHFSVIGFT